MPPSVFLNDTRHVLFTFPNRIVKTVGGKTKTPMFPFILEWGLILGSTKPGAANQILVRQPENDLRWPPGGRNEHWDGSMQTHCRLFGKSQRRDHASFLLLKDNSCGLFFLTLQVLQKGRKCLVLSFAKLN